MPGVVTGSTGELAERLITIEVGRYHATLFPDIQFVAIEGAGHAPMEEKPAEFVEAVVGFYDNLAHRDTRSRLASSRER